MDILDQVTFLHTVIQESSFCYLGMLLSSIQSVWKDGRSKVVPVDV